jgi:hypothetical protein
MEMEDEEYNAYINERLAMEKRLKESILETSQYTVNESFIKKS